MVDTPCCEECVDATDEFDLVLVRNDHIGDGEEFLGKGSGRRRVEDRRRPPLLGVDERADHRLDGNLELRQHDGARRRAAAVTSAFAPGTTTIVFSPSPPTVISARPVGVAAIDGVFVVSIPSSAATARSRAPASSSPKRADEGDARTAAGGGNRLVEPLAARILVVAVAEQRLARSRDAGGADDEIEIRAADDDDVERAAAIWGRQLAARALHRWARSTGIRRHGARPPTRRPRTRTRGAHGRNPCSRCARCSWHTPAWPRLASFPCLRTLSCRWKEQMRETTAGALAHPVVVRCDPIDRHFDCSHCSPPGELRPCVVGTLR